MLMLMITHQATARLDHIEKHIEEARRAISTIENENTNLPVKLKAASMLAIEFGVIKGDAETALMVIGISDWDSSKQ